MDLTVRASLISRLSAHLSNLQLRLVSAHQVKENDAFCWICHKEGELTCCELCPRVYHLKCLAIEAPGDDWVCPECEVSDGQRLPGRSLCQLGGQFGSSLQGNDEGRMPGYPFQGHGDDQLGHFVHSFEICSE